MATLIQDYFGRHDLRQINGDRLLQSLTISLDGGDPIDFTDYTLSGGIYSMNGQELCAFDFSLEESGTKIVFSVDAVDVPASGTYRYFIAGDDGTGRRTFVVGKIAVKEVWEE